MPVEARNSVGKPVLMGSCLCDSVRWSFHGEIPDATICNCSACRRYGALWAYDFEGHGIVVDDPKAALSSYSRGKGLLTFDVCSICGNLVCWRGTETGRDGRRRIAVNLRLAEPDDVAHIPLQRFDGRDSFEDLPKDGRCVADVWF